ncbi:MAG: YkvA family protein [Egibacteraceae bacterium]
MSRRSSGSSYDRAASAPRSRIFQRLQMRAADYIGEPGKMRDLVNRAVTKSKTEEVDEMGAVVDDLRALTRLVRAYAKSEYREVKTESVILIVAAILYFVSPVDVIPDFLPGGFLDDAAVLGFVVRRLRGEVDNFLAWEQERAEIIDIDDAWEEESGR